MIGSRPEIARQQLEWKKGSQQQSHPDLEENKKSEDRQQHATTQDKHRRPSVVDSTFEPAREQKQGGPVPGISATRAIGETGFENKA